MITETQQPEKANETRREVSALSALLSTPIKLILVFFTVYFIANWLTPYDDTDDIANGERSGMILYTDNLTGCQYLKASFFAELTPRVDGSGSHVGCR